MFTFNPVIEDKSPNCRCKDCLPAFWYRTNTEHNYLICNCDLMHSVTFPNENEKIVTCSGCEDIMPHSDRADRSACISVKVLYGMLPTSVNFIAIVYTYKN